MLIIIMKFNNNLLAIILLLCIIIVIGYILNKKSNNPVQHFENEKKNPSQLAIDIFNFITPNTEFSQFIDFIKKKENISYNIIKPQTFYELITFKKLNILTPEKIESYLIG